MSKEEGLMLIHLLNSVIEKSKLREREREVIVKRFGLDDGEAKMLETVGNSIGITRERVRQIEAQALRKMREHLGDTSEYDWLLEIKGYISLLKALRG